MPASAVARSLSLLLSVALLVPGFAHARELDPISQDEMNRRLGELQHVPYAGKALEKDEGWLSSCHKSTVTVPVGDPTTGATKDQPLTIIRPDVNAPLPVVILVPTIAGMSPVENSVASQLCDMKIAVILADVDDNSVPDQMPSWGMEDARNKYSIMALRTTIDYAAQNPYFDPSRIGMMGLSLGGIVTSFMAGVEAERLAAVVIVVGGGDLPYVLSVSDNEQVSELRQKRMQSENMTAPEQYEDKLRETMHFDPLNFAVRGATDKIFMVMSSNDTKVPTVVQNALFNALGKPKNTVFSTGHVETVIGLTYFYFDEVTNFLSDRFGLPHVSAEKVKRAHALATIPAPHPAPEGVH